MHGVKPDVPTVKAIAHEYHSSPCGVWVCVLPNTGATMSLIPLNMVRRLNLKVNESDTNYTLINASGEYMNVLGTTEESNTTEVYCIIRDELGEDEILLSYSDMKDWGLLSKDFPKVPKVNTPAAVKKVSVLVKKIKKVKNAKYLCGLSQLMTLPLSPGVLYIIPLPLVRGIVVSKVL